MLADKLKKWTDLKGTVSKHLKILENVEEGQIGSDSDEVDLKSESSEKKEEVAVFPLTSQFSFNKATDFWVQIQSDESHPLNGIAQGNLDSIQESTIIKSGIAEDAAFLRNTLLPVVSVDDWESRLFFLSKPFSFRPEVSSVQFQKRLDRENTLLEPLFGQSDLNKELAIRALNIFLQRSNSAIKIPETDILLRLSEDSLPDVFYKVDIDKSFLQVDIDKGAVPSTRDLTKAAKDRDFAVEIALKMRGHVKGFSLMILTEYTKEASLSLLSDILESSEELYSPQGFKRFLGYIDTYMRWPLSSQGIVWLNKDKVRYDYLTAEGKVESLNFGERSLRDLELEEFNKPGENYFEISQSMIKKGKGEFTSLWLDQGLSDVTVIKLCLKEQHEGYLLINGSLKSWNKDGLDKNEVLEKISLKLYLDNERFRTSIQNVILDKFTAIHPSVEWKFKQAALNYVEQKQESGMAELDPIVFRNVFPLYGASDIRGSSSLRNTAIQSDLKAQLSVAGKIVQKVIDVTPIPVFRELKFRIEEQIKHLDEGLMAGDELAILDFLRSDVEPVFERFDNDTYKVKNFIEEYNSLINTDHGAFYIERKKFDDSVTLLNEVITAYYDEEQNSFQEVFPHYFEKQATDGVDHTIYIGPSLCNEHEFHPIYLENMRIWQLMVICGAAFVAERLKSSLSVPLELTHLIAVQANPLSIRFNPDEKKFEVDGNYNIRYEIMKKRVDKACLKDSKERLTQPGKLAVVYSHRQERVNYLKYLNFLKSEEYLLDDIEELELEDLQGIQGLRALRVSINFGYSAPNSKSENKNVDQVLNKSRNWLSSKKGHVEAAAQRLNNVASELSEKVSIHRAGDNKPDSE